MNLSSKINNFRQRWKEKKISAFALDEEIKSSNDINSLDSQSNSKSNDFIESTKNEMKIISETAHESSTQVDEVKEQEYDFKQATVEYLLKEKSEIHFPFNELNIANIKHNVMYEMTTKKLDKLEKSVQNSKDVIQQNRNDIEEIKRKSEILIKASEIAISKLVILEDEIDNIRYEAKNKRFHIVSLLLCIFSFLSSMLMLFWNNLKIKEKRKE